MTAPARPRFSIVTAAYDVAAYLPEFIASIEGQALGPGQLEVIVVDDGSTDGSRELLEAWRGRSALPVTVLTQANAGQGAARNAGLERATGDWITFTDADDVLEPGYLAAADVFARAHPEVDVMAGRVLRLDEATGEVLDSHPRRWQFAAGSRVADLDSEPNVFPGTSTTTLFRGDRLRETGLRFDAELRPHFEDQHFTARFLLALDRPLVGLVADARYRYRKRVANDSTFQRLHADAGAYTTVLERGYLDLVRRSRERFGAVVPWIQHELLYELTRLYFREADAWPSRLAIPPGLEDRFHDLFGEVARSLDPEQVYAHTATRLEGIWAEVLVHGYRDERWVSATADRTAIDRVMRLQRVSYRYRGEAPVERLELDGNLIEPAFAKVRAVRYFGRTELQERILWVVARGGVRLSLDGARVEIGPPRAPVSAVEALRAGEPVSRRRSLARRFGRQATWAALTRLLAGTVFRRRHRSAWLLVDSLDHGGGEAERLFAHLRRDRPDVNAWFVLARRSPDWDRLRRSGERRVVAFDSLQWRLLLLNADWVLASELEDAITRPRPAPGDPPRRWRFGLLRRDLFAGDTSVWLNPHRLDLVPVATEAELDAAAANGSPYGLTRKEVHLTGLPGDGGDAADRLVTTIEALGRPWQAARMEPHA